MTFLKTQLRRRRNPFAVFQTALPFILPPDRAVALAWDTLAKYSLFVIGGSWALPIILYFFAASLKACSEK